MYPNLDEYFYYIIFPYQHQVCVHAAANALVDVLRSINFYKERSPHLST